MHLWALETTELFAAIKLAFLLVNRLPLESVICWEREWKFCAELGQHGWSPKMQSAASPLCVVNTTFTHAGPWEADLSGDNREDGGKVCKQEIPRPGRMFERGVHCPAARPPCFFPTIRGFPCYQSFSLKWQVSVWPLCKVCVSVPWAGLDLCRVRWQEFWGLLWHLCLLREVPRAPLWIWAVTSTLQAEDLLLPAQLPSHFTQLTCLFSQLLQFLFTS